MLKLRIASLLHMVAARHGLPDRDVEEAHNRPWLEA